MADAPDSKSGERKLVWVRLPPPAPPVAITLRPMEIRATHLRRAVWLSALSSIWSGTVGSIAIYAGWVSGSLSLFGFGADAAIDAIASGILIWRFLVESREPQRASRVERTAERVVGLSLVLLAVYLVIGALRSLIAQAHPESASWNVALLLASAVVLPPLAIAKYRVAARLGSGALRADSILTAVAALLALISLATLVATAALGFWWADAIGALILSLIVLREGWASLGLSTG
jgi:divalent metal cation (Fe/Co/Zn/Cd) transporter